MRAAFPQYRISNPRYRQRYQKNIELMIFSAKKWNNGKELKAVMKVNTAISFDMMEAPLRNAFRQYLVPLLGDAMVGEVVEIYEFGPNPDVLEQNTEGATEREKLTAACWRSANARTRTWRSGTISMKSACVSPMRASNVRNPTTANHSSRCTSTRKITCGHRYATRGSMRSTSCLSFCMPI